jgi:streptogramin lyase
VGVNRILKFDSQGQFLLEWGGSGSGPGLFNDPHSIDVDQDGTVFVTDVFNFRVQRFDSSGNYLGEWNNTALTTTTLIRPFSVAAGDDGTIYVVDEANALHRYHLESP